ncbi:hypothetical protein PVAP13_4KG116600 [Panicum virgatum]|uniref:Uncharacterized protein n=1 Tax=Panicum virgatum TaxID=38727 RepID=A0A8T0TUP6_PANVG|nr:hypothetical protein PVAP13_4KG116600 [Panicum virgatum]
MSSRLPARPRLPSLRKISQSNPSIKLFNPRFQPARPPPPGRLPPPPPPVIPSAAHPRPRGRIRKASASPLLASILERHLHKDRESGKAGRPVDPRRHRQRSSSASLTPADQTGLTGRPDRSDRSASAGAKFGCQQGAACGRWFWALCPSCHQQLSGHLRCHPV